MEHIMLDLETLSTRADAVIVSIGAVKFDLDGGLEDPCFYTVCHLDQPDRHMSPDTLGWWMTQTDDARAVFNDSNKMYLSDALLELINFIDHPQYKLWANGADFDIPIINHALGTQGLKTSVRHSNHRCYRTMKNLYSQVPMPEFDGTRHNALADAIHQAKHLQAIYKFMKEGVIEPPKRGFGAQK